MSVTYPDNGLTTFSALGREERLVVVLAVDLAIELHETHVDKLAAALVTSETMRTPGLVQCQHERTSGNKNVNLTANQYHRLLTNQPQTMGSCLL